MSKSVYLSGWHLYLTLCNEGATIVSANKEVVSVKYTEDNKSYTKAFKPICLLQAYGMAKKANNIEIMAMIMAAKLGTCE